MNLLDFQQFDDPQQMGLLSLAAGLMAPGRYPGAAGFGESLSNGLMSGMQGYAAARDALAKRALAQAQLAHQQAQMEMERKKMGWEESDRGRADAQRAAIEGYLRNLDPTGAKLAEYRLDPKSFVERNFRKPPGISNLDPKDYTPESWASYIQGGQNDTTVLRPRTKMEPINGVATNLYDTPAGTVLPQDPTKPIIRGANGQPAVNQLAAAWESKDDPFTLSGGGQVVPNKAAQDFAIRRATAGAATVSMGAPFAAIPPGSDTPQMFQPGNRPGVAPVPLGLAPAKDPLKPIPPTQMEAISGNRAALAKIDEATRLITERPGSLGMQNALPDSVNQRVDLKGVDARAALADVAGQKFHDLSGAAITASEAERLRPYIPSASDSPATALKKLGRLRQEYANTLAQQESSYSKEQGYKSPPQWKAPSKQFDVDGSKVIGVLNPADGNYYVTRGGKKYRIEE